MSEIGTAPWPVWLVDVSSSTSASQWFDSQIGHIYLGLGFNPWLGNIREVMDP